MTKYIFVTEKLLLELAKAGKEYGQLKIAFENGVESADVKVMAEKYLNDIYEQCTQIEVPDWATHFAGIRDEWKNYGQFDQWQRIQK